MGIVTEVMKPLTDTYETVLRANANMSWPERKKIALQTAATKWLPEAPKIISTALQATRQNKGAAISQEMLEAIRLSTALGQAVRRVKKDEIGKQESPKPPRTTANSVYRNWLAKSDFVANDAQVSHFSGFNDVTFSNIRSDMKSEGWDFEKTTKPTLGWKVVKRPETGEDLLKKFYASLSPEQIALVKQITAD